jgi:hypothetical protein
LGENNDWTTVSGSDEYRGGGGSPMREKREKRGERERRKKRFARLKLPTSCANLSGVIESCRLV